MKLLRLGLPTLAGAALALLVGSSAQATTVQCCDTSSDATPPSQLDITFDFSVVGTTLTVTVTNNDGGGFGFNVSEIYFNASANVTSVAFASATLNPGASDVTAGWAPLLTNPSPDGFGVFDYGLADGVGEGNPNIINPGESIAFVFTVNAGLADADFIVAQGSGYLVAAKFVNGPDDPEDPGNEDSAFGAAPEPGMLGLFALGLAGLGFASRRRA